MAWSAPRPSPPWPGHKAPGTRLAAGEVEIRATVVELDRAHRLATLKGPKGNVVTVEVPAEVKNFDQEGVGDDLVVRYAAAAAARLEPASKSGIRERVESTSAATAASGGMPGSAAQRTVEVLVVVQAPGRKARTATLRGARRTRSVNVPEGVDISKIKVGDEVRAVMIEARVLNVERVAVSKSPAAPPPLGVGAGRAIGTAPVRALPTCSDRQRACQPAFTRNRHACSKGSV